MSNQVGVVAKQQNTITVSVGNGGLLGEALGFIDKNFNGGLGYVGVAVKGYNMIPSQLKRANSYKLSKLIGVKSGIIFQSAKGFMTGTGKLVSKLGATANVLSVAAITYDVFDDGQVKTSSVVNGTLLTVALTIPVTAPFIAAYGILDYTFDIGDKLDENFGSINTHIYE